MQRTPRHNIGNSKAILMFRPAVPNHCSPSHKCSPGVNQVLTEVQKCNNMLRLKVPCFLTNLITFLKKASKMLGPSKLDVSFLKYIKGSYKMTLRHHLLWHRSTRVAYCGIESYTAVSSTAALSHFIWSCIFFTILLPIIK